MKTNLLARCKFFLTSLAATAKNPTVWVKIISEPTWTPAACPLDDIFDMVGCDQGCSTAIGSFIHHNMVWQAVEDVITEEPFSSELSKSDFATYPEVPLSSKSVLADALLVDVPAFLLKVRDSKELEAFVQGIEKELAASIVDPDANLEGGLPLGLA